VPENNNPYWYLDYYMTAIEAGVIKPPELDNIGTPLPPEKKRKMDDIAGPPLFHGTPDLVLNSILHEAIPPEERN
jgi:hypothetical protein